VTAEDREKEETVYDRTKPTIWNKGSEKSVMKDRYPAVAIEVSRGSVLLVKGGGR
jgi:hypothetical protein